MKGSAERFHARVDRSFGPNACWPWLGFVDKKTGYGKVQVNCKTWLAHRFAYKLEHGCLSKLYVLHSCDNPPCVNPAHLREGTPKENAADRDSRGRANLQIGENNHSAKLTAAKVRWIRKSYAEGQYTQLELANKFGVTGRAIGLVVSQKTWCHVTQGNQLSMSNIKIDLNLKDLSLSQVAAITSLLSGPTAVEAKPAEKPKAKADSKAKDADAITAKKKAEAAAKAKAKVAEVKAKKAKAKAEAEAVEPEPSSSAAPAEVDDDWDDEAEAVGPSELEKYAKAKKWRDLATMLVTDGYNTAETLFTKCQELKEDVPLLSKIPDDANLRIRCDRAIELLGA